jgi:glycosyltransferase involved in cell wall biosynthesis
MRWALLGPLHPYRGGIAHYGALLAQELAREDAVHALSFTRLYPGLLFPGRSQYDTSEKPLSYPAARRLDSIDPLSWERTARAIAALAPDALLIHWWHPFFGAAYGTLLRRVAHLSPRCRRLLLCHNVLPHERSRVDSWLTRYAFGPAQGFLVHSSDQAERLRALRPGAACAVHPHPRYGAFRAEAGPSHEEARRRLGIPPDQPVALFFGYVRAYKGLDLALGALARAPVADLRLWVVGEFYEDRASYEAQIRSLGLTDRVVLVDRYVPNEELPLYFQAADLVVQPYRSATQSGIAQIAFAFGKPVIATRVGGLPEQIADGVTGLLVPPGDEQALAAALERAFTERLAERMAPAIAAASARASWEGLAAALRALAEEVRA